MYSPFIIHITSVQLYNYNKDNVQTIVQILLKMYIYITTIKHQF